MSPEAFANRWSPGKGGRMGPLAWVWGEPGPMEGMGGMHCGKGHWAAAAQSSQGHTSGRQPVQKDKESCFVLTILPTYRVTLGQRFHLSKPQFPLL